MAASTSRVRKRVWVQDVAVQADVLQARVSAIALRPSMTPEQHALAERVLELIQSAKDAAFRDNPIPSRWTMWWRGTLIEAAYRNLHAAEALIVCLYNDIEVNAEIPDAVARVEAGLHRDDPRRSRAIALLALPTSSADHAFVRERLRKTIEVGFAHTDEQHARLRSFRNLVLGATAAITLVTLGFILVVAGNPTWVPLCFTPETGQVCPTGHRAASASDVLVVALLGVLGGTLAGAVSISRLRGSSVPYDVPTALALLKAPFGAMTAIGALIAIRGDFVPGLSALDSQVQILAYALIFGYAQQLLTGLIDRQAQTVLDSLPRKGSEQGRPEVVNAPMGADAPQVV